MWIKNNLFPSMSLETKRELGRIDFGRYMFAFAILHEYSHDSKIRILD